MATRDSDAEFEDRMGAEGKTKICLAFRFAHI